MVRTPGRGEDQWFVRPSGPEACSAKDPPDRARSDPDPELAELALDPHAPPPRALPAQAQDQISSVAIQRGSTRGSLAVGPHPPEELAVPAKKRLRPDHERGPPIPRERPARRGEERSTPVAKLWTADRPAEDLHLVAEDGVLELELGDVPTSGERPNEANEDEVREGSQGGRMLHIPATAGRNRVSDPHR
jgi:hypothetical protein